MDLLRSKVLNILLVLPALLIGFTIHEFAHAYMADKLGDKTPRFQGRLTFNPLAHIDPLGFIMILIAGFGWAKPVQTNPYAYKNYYKDDLKVSIAGPISNLIVAVIFTPILLLYEKYALINISNVKLAVVIYYMMQFIIKYNIMLCIFNLIPIPSLDGFHILEDLFPSRFTKYKYKIQQYQILILILFLVTPLFDYIVGIPSNLIYKLLRNIGKLII
ncbi:MAG: site-2 protease family protein [Clostridiales bacterium]|uniref:site-2 protease family protein n=1 Tax=Clostridium sp. N3C TaxID=1776758 RepID=UPI00092E05AC|nr:site-2 protease family protein [Clostridium sp. N3C]NLZ49241.1 site-2 protease family protein [Clostridiales bacterium]SCN24782.1 Zn-dependent proteases [Clostridium sp. N3C]